MLQGPVRMSLQPAEAAVASPFPASVSGMERKGGVTFLAEVGSVALPWQQQPQGLSRSVGKESQTNSRMSILSLQRAEKGLW